MNNLHVYEYQGYTYRPWDEVGEDNRKTYHDVFTPELERLHLPISPYGYVSREYFILWVDCGCPYPSNQRVSLGQLKELVFTKITETELENTNQL